MTKKDSSRSIRPLGAQDAEALFAFYQALSDDVVYFYRPFREVTTSVIREHLKQADEGDVYALGLGAEDGRVMGHAFLNGLRGGSPSFGIGLHQSILDRGWGSRLTAAVVQHADELAIARVELSVMKENTRAQAVYRKFGFSVCGETSFRGENDSWVMERRSTRTYTDVKESEP